MSRAITLTALAVGALAISLAASPAQARHRHGHAHRHGHHAATATASGCDRDCLLGQARRFMDAMVARAPQTLPWAQSVRYSENAVPMQIGDGLWGTISGHTPPALEAADPAAGQVAWIGVVQEHGQPAFYALRLKIEDGRIAEAEAVIRRKGGPPQYGDPDQFPPAPAFAAALPASQRAGRKALNDAVDGYFAAIEGRRPAAEVRLGPDCRRLDNGVLTSTGPDAEGGVQGCRAQLQARVFAPIRDVRARRYPIVDEARGVVIAEGLFDLPATAAKPAAGLGWAADYPYSVDYLAAFKLEHGRIVAIDSVSDALPYLMPPP